MTARHLGAVALLAALVNLPLGHGLVSGRDVPAGLVGVTAVADLFLLLVLGLGLTLGRRRDRPLLLVAETDLTRCRPAGRVEALPDGRWLVEGDVRDLGADWVEIDAGGRLVRVALDGHANPARHQQPVRALGRLADS
ncbi:hypothetical protein [Nocardioides sp. SYSU D00038]|uniref:hypothetical protein n=1 Tax=Nocardioides sp. SYSU D00038 TaxID=2812554 RepID=UPI0019680651|nr:hypothetical protein [Nocardioides sp. SYSU D00038]